MLPLRLSPTHHTVICDDIAASSARRPRVAGVALIADSVHGAALAAVRGAAVPLTLPRCPKALFKHLVAVRSGTRAVIGHVDPDQCHRGDGYRPSLCATASSNSSRWRSAVGRVRRRSRDRLTRASRPRSCCGPDLVATSAGASDGFRDRTCGLRSRRRSAATRLGRRTDSGHFWGSPMSSSSNRPMTTFSGFFASWETPREISSHCLAPTRRQSATGSRTRRASRPQGRRRSADVLGDAGAERLGDPVRFGVRPDKENRNVSVACPQFLECRIAVGLTVVTETTRRRPRRSAGPARCSEARTLALVVACVDFG